MIGKLAGELEGWEFAALLFNTLLGSSVTLFMTTKLHYCVQSADCHDLLKRLPSKRNL